jgi:hypothetical protein
MRTIDSAIAMTTSGKLRAYAALLQQWDAYELHGLVLEKLGYRDLAVTLIIAARQLDEGSR